MAIRKVINGEAINLDNGSGGGSSPSASGVSYDNIDSGLDATNAQDAIDELKDGLDGKQSKLINPLTQSDVVNNLTSSSTTKPLSAAQGKALKDAQVTIKHKTVSFTIDAYGNIPLTAYNSFITANNFITAFVTYSNGVILCFPYYYNGNISFRVFVESSGTLMVLTNASIECTFTYT